MSDDATLPDFIRLAKVDAGTIDIDGTTHNYYVLSRELEPLLPGFVGFTGNQFLFISEDVPVEYRPYILAHEVREFTQRAGQRGRCRATLEQELEEVPDDIRVEYTRYRRDRFEDLVAYYADNQDPNMQGFKAELEGSLALLETLMAHINEDEPA